MKNVWFKNYIKIFVYFFKNTNVYKNIKIEGCCINNSKNIVILNHTSIIDNIIIAKLMDQNSFGWNNLRTISRISKKTLQNKILEIHGMLLVNKDFVHDSGTSNTIIPLWINHKSNLQILIFPEGTIYQKAPCIDKMYENIFRQNRIKPYRNVLMPKIGMLNILIDKLKSSVQDVYDISILYHINGERIVREINILKSLSNPNLRITVLIKKYSLQEFINNPYFIFKVWSIKDQWIEKQIL